MPNKTWYRSSLNCRKHTIKTLTIGESLQCPWWPLPRKGNPLPMNRRNERTLTPSHPSVEGQPYSQGRALFTFIVEMGVSSNYRCCKLQVLQIAHVAKCTCCKGAEMPSCQGAKIPRCQLQTRLGKCGKIGKKKNDLHTMKQILYYMGFLSLFGWAPSRALKVWHTLRSRIKAEKGQPTQKLCKKVCLKMISRQNLVFYTQVYFYLYFFSGKSGPPLVENFTIFFGTLSLPTGSGH